MLKSKMMISANSFEGIRILSVIDHTLGEEVGAVMERADQRCQTRDLLLIRDLCITARKRRSNLHGKIESGRLQD